MDVRADEADDDVSLAEVDEMLGEAFEVEGRSGGDQVTNALVAVRPDRNDQIDTSSDLGTVGME